MTLLISIGLFVVSASVHEGTKEGVQPINVPPLHVKSIFFSNVSDRLGKVFPLQN
jgi:hypothetical protein